jgi:hypothetical protein
VTRRRGARGVSSTGADGKHAYLIHARESDGRIIKALMVEDEHRLAERYSNRICGDLLADIEKILGDQPPDHEAFRDGIYRALYQLLVNVLSRPRG